MIQKLTSLDSCEHFMEEINSDPDFSQPMFSTQQIADELRQAMADGSDRCVLGVFCDGVLSGVFEFLIDGAERYLEMIVGLSRSGTAYEEIAEYLRTNYSGFQADFTFNPANALICDMLKRKGAEFFEEQQRMVLSGNPAVSDADGVEPLSGRYLEQYLAMHKTDCYWTGDKVAAAPDRFSVYLAVDDGAVVGYIDMTNCYAVNEPGDVLVKKEYRGKGWGKKLLARAIEMNRPAGMALLVDVNNTPALSLYESVGFIKAPGANHRTASWNIE